MPRSCSTDTDRIRRFGRRKSKQGTQRYRGCCLTTRLCDLQCRSLRTTGSDPAQATRGSCGESVRWGGKVSPLANVYMPAGYYSAGMAACSLGFSSLGSRIAGGGSSNWYKTFARGDPLVCGGQFGDYSIYAERPKRRALLMRTARDMPCRLRRRGRPCAGRPSRSKPRAGRCARPGPWRGSRTGR